MKAHRASVMLAAACAMLAPPAAAQVADEIVLDILRQCARIDDPTARLACFDNNIRSAGAPARASTPGRMEVPQGGGGAQVAVRPSGSSPSGSTAGFVGNANPGASAGLPGNAESLSARVSRVDPLEPGVYVLTLADGARWQFVEGVETSYRVPRSGDTVTIDRASLGSYLMRFNDQIGVRIRPVQ
jgi:hypothetical protein